MAHGDQNQSGFPHLSLRVKAEADLRLGVDVRSSFHQDFHNLNLTRQRGDVKRRVSLLQLQNILFTLGTRSQCKKVVRDKQKQRVFSRSATPWRDHFSYVVQQLLLCLCGTATLLE